MNRATPSQRLRCGARAVTLIELLVVLGLLIAIFALALPLVLQSKRGEALQRSQEALMTALESVRAHAQREGIIIEVTAGAGGHRLLASELPIDGGEAKAIPSLAFEIEAPMKLVMSDAGSTLALFLPDGSAPLARRIVLVNSDADDPGESGIVISALLGRARIEALPAKGIEEDSPEATEDEVTPPLKEQSPAPVPTPTTAPASPGGET